MFTTLDIELETHAMACDLTGVKQVRAAIHDMAARHPGWRVVKHVSDAYYSHLCGSHEDALHSIELACEEGVYGSLYSPWVISATTLKVQILVELDRIEDALSCGQPMLAQCQAEEMHFHARNLMTVVALAEALNGNTERALSLIREVIAKQHELGVSGLQLGLSYEQRAHIAIVMNDEKTFQKYAQLCQEQYRVGHNPVLTAKYEKLVEEARKQGLYVSSDEKERNELGNKLSSKQIQPRDVSSSISECRDSDQRTQRALNLLLEHCDARSGYLFGLQEQGLTCLSESEGARVPDELQQLANDYFQAELEESVMVTMTALDEKVEAGQELKITLSDGQTFESVLLYSLDENRSIIVGLAVLVPKNNKLRAINPEFITAISDALLDTGDVVSMYAAA